MSTTFITNGQPHFITSQSAVNYCKKNQKNNYIVLPFVLLFIIISVGFVGFLYYLEMRLHDYNYHINEVMRNYTNNVDNEINKLREQIPQSKFTFDVLFKNQTAQSNCTVVEILQNQIEQLIAKVEELQRKLASKQSVDVQKLLQESQSDRYKSVAIENVEEYPEIEEIAGDDLINVAQSSDDLINVAQSRDNPINVAHSRDDNFKLYHRKNRTSAEIFDNIRPLNITRRNRTFSSLEQHSKVNDYVRSKRDTELSSYNVIETSRENAQLKRETDVQKLSNRTNQTTKNARSQCCCVSCEEVTTRNRDILQKNTDEHSKKQIRSARNSSSKEVEENEDGNEVRTIIAAHFGARPPNQTATQNNHVRHATGEYKHWQKSAWFEEYNVNKHFAITNGDIEVHSSGLYFVYAQILYSDTNDVYGYMVYQNSEIVLQCITSAFSTSNMTKKSNTCFTGGIIKCNAGDKISIKTTEMYRNVVLESSRSFVGMFKIGESQIMR